MLVYSEKIKFKTKGNSDIIDITNIVDRKIQDNKIISGIVTIFVPGATGGLTTLEYEPGLVDDLKSFFERIIPENDKYEHNLSHPDSNGHSHIRASMIGPSICVPFLNKKLQLGLWQQLIFIDFDNRPRERELVVQIMGE
jgi:secondary thiamine-phosphate synthase enzyme